MVAGCWHWHHHRRNNLLQSYFELGKGLFGAPVSNLHFGAVRGKARFGRPYLIGETEIEVVFGSAISSQIR
jgi:hypothetical protein